MTTKLKPATALVLTCALLTACATQSPVIYSQAKLPGVDDAKIQRDIDE